MIDAAPVMPENVKIEGAFCDRPVASTVKGAVSQQGFMARIAPS
ncbi:hypothetical protein K227x_30420 [Rubripirellula lacrimiformis]|uniref:Uncharacterized protein n=1 Tax=Rubripirellula lacrimiformis TaxID=1930273 RepID=A0A517NBY0_9BACT|nr:hypothetical protein K227x_30420 [Rubripirellula lacrimiformis]